MRGVTENRILGPADRLLQRGAEAVGIGHTLHRTSVAIFQGDEATPPGTTVPDPYFGGEGPTRTTCTACGGCMVGCLHGAKNSLDKNYLYFAEKHGARIFAETRVVDVKPLNGSADGAAGYEVHTAPGQRLTSRGVVVAASALGTLDLLLRLKEKGLLPLLSPRLLARAH